MDSAFLTPWEMADASRYDAHMRQYLPCHALLRSLPLALVLLSGMLATGCSPTARPADTAPQAAQPTPTMFRVMTYNIHHGEGTDGRFDLDRLADVIRTQDPVFVALQEVDQRTRRAHGYDQARALGSLTGMQSFYGRAMDYDEGGYGDAVLSKYPIVRSGVERLPHTDGYEPRVAVWVDANVPDIGMVRFASTHWQHNLAADRIAQAEQVAAFFARRGEQVPGIVIVAGDLNAEPGSAPMEVMFRSFTDAAAANPQPTFPSAESNVRIDYILIRSGDPCRAERAWTLDEPVASDHAPLVADLAVLNPE